MKKKTGNEAHKPKVYKLPMAQINWSKLEAEAERTGKSPEMWIENIVLEALEKLPPTEWEQGLQGTWFGLGVVTLTPGASCTLTDLIQVPLHLLRLYVTTPDDLERIGDISIDALLFGKSAKEGGFSPMPAVIADRPFGANVDGFLQPGMSVQLRVTNHSSQAVRVSAGFKAKRER